MEGKHHPENGKQNSAVRSRCAPDGAREKNEAFWVGGSGLAALPRLAGEHLR